MLSIKIVLGIGLAIVLSNAVSSQHIGLQSRNALVHGQINSVAVVASSTDPPIAGPIEQ